MSFSLKSRAAHRFNLSTARLLLGLASVLGQSAYAQSMGHGLVTYVTPIILFLGVGSVLIALVSAVFKPEWIKSAVYAAIIMVVIFFILKNMGGLESAVQQ